MKIKHLFILIYLFVTNFVFSQKLIIGKTFDFGLKIEQDLGFAMMDENNVYVKSAIDKDPYTQLLIRKFDKDYNLINSFSQKFPMVDSRAYWNYIGSMSAPNQVVFFTNSYLGKLKKNTLFKTVFDKKTEKFTSTAIETFPIETAFSSGDFDFAVSDNNRYSAVVYYPKEKKKEPQNITVFLLDNNTAEVVWKKIYASNDETVRRYCAVSNSGKVVITRNPNTYKGASKLVILTKDGQDEKLLDADNLIFQPYIFSKGSQEYIFAFNSTDRFNQNYYAYLMMYDLNNGRMVSNYKTDEFNIIKDPEKVLIRKIYYQNDVFIVFTEARLSAGKITKPSELGGTFTEDVYKWDKPMIFTFKDNGDFVYKTTIESESVPALDIFKSFGVDNSMGNLMVYDKNFYLVLKRYSPDLAYKFYVFDEDKKVTTVGDFNDGKTVRNLFTIAPDKKSYLFLKVIEGSPYTAFIENISGFEEKKVKK